MVTLWVVWCSIISLFQRESQGTEVLNNAAAELKPGLQSRLSGPKPEFLKCYTDESHTENLMLATEMFYYILVVSFTSAQKDTPKSWPMNLCMWPYLSKGYL